MDSYKFQYKDFRGEWKDCFYLDRLQGLSEEQVWQKYDEYLQQVEGEYRLVKTEQKFLVKSIYKDALADGSDEWVLWSTEANQDEAYKKVEKNNLDYALRVFKVFIEQTEEVLEVPKPIQYEIHVFGAMNQTCGWVEWKNRLFTGTLEECLEELEKRVKISVNDIHGDRVAFKIVEAGKCSTK